MCCQHTPEIAPDACRNQAAAHHTPTSLSCHLVEKLRQAARGGLVEDDLKSASMRRGLGLATGRARDHILEPGGRGALIGVRLSPRRSRPRDPSDLRFERADRPSVFGGSASEGPATVMVRFGEQCLPVSLAEGARVDQRDRLVREIEQPNRVDDVGTAAAEAAAEDVAGDPEIVEQNTERARLLTGGERYSNSAECCSGGASARSASSRRERQIGGALRVSDRRRGAERVAGGDAAMVAARLRRPRGPGVSGFSGQACPRPPASRGTS